MSIELACHAGVNTMHAVTEAEHAIGHLGSIAIYNIYMHIAMSMSSVHVYLGSIAIYT